MTITSLLENTSEREDILTEHGLSLYIETKSHKILFDMGQSDLFAHNAKKLNVDLSDVDLAILSHGHYDHGGGLAHFLTINEKAPVFIHKDAFLPHYNGTEKYIGLDPSLSDHPRLLYTDDSLRLDDGLMLFSCNDRTKKYPLGSFGLTEKTENGYIPDDFRHEQYLLIKEDGKTVLISGCSHKGIIDITSWFLPDILIGGFHFSKMPLDDTLIHAAKLLDSYPTVYYTCHCTGEAQFSMMQEQMSDLFYLSCGQTIII